jgi:hypothetical protein
MKKTENSKILAKNQQKTPKAGKTGPILSKMTRITIKKHM